MNRYILGAILAGATVLVMYGVGSGNQVASWIDNLGQSTSDGANQVANNFEPVSGSEPIQQAGQLAQRQTPQASPVSASDNFGEPTEQAQDTADTNSGQSQAGTTDTGASGTPAPTGSAGGESSQSGQAVDTSIPALW
ncbi:hypothetical protein [Almyronema epifaneia]|uniref:Uncharacterized protein n=1 Tax=Almyronema epifaneia S1 TaxID=2991925 RepID=A0ABW6ID78_9CYAN